MHDKIVEQVRRTREEYARKFNYDLDAMAADLQQKQQLSAERLVSLPKRPPSVIPSPVNDLKESRQS